MTDWDSYLQAVLERCSKATRGPWVKELEEDWSSEDSTHPAQIETGWIKNVSEYLECGTHKAKIKTEDLDFICAARTDVEILARSVMELRESIQEGYSTLDAPDVQGNHALNRMKEALARAPESFMEVEK